jgi:hypothetical protein
MSGIGGMSRIGARKALLMPAGTGLRIGALYVAKRRPAVLYVLKARYKQKFAEPRR